MSEVVLNPVSGVPLLGDLLGKLDEAIMQVGFPLWLRAFLELAVSGVACFYLLRLITGRLLPWLATVLVRPACAVVDAARAVLLLPDLAISMAVRRTGHVPPEPVHTYGSVVMTMTDGVQNGVRYLVPKLAAARRANRVALIVVLVAGFLVWNSQACTGTPCVAPVTAWTTSFGVWFNGPS
jgi:hypothetical protein